MTKQKVLQPLVSFMPTFFVQSWLVNTLCVDQLSRGEAFRLRVELILARFLFVVNRVSEIFHFPLFLFFEHVQFAIDRHFEARSFKAPFGQLAPQKDH